MAEYKFQVHGVIEAAGEGPVIDALKAAVEGIAVGDTGHKLFAEGARIRKLVVERLESKAST